MYHREMTTLKLKDYEIYIEEIWDTYRAFLKQNAYSQILVIVDENTRRDCWPILQKASEGIELKLIETKSGEQHKNNQTCAQIWQAMMDFGADRKALTINLGGGVIGDMGGFCAATFKRGMDFIQMPTTLLSQVDSSIGGKLGIDFGQVKNSIGLFKNPKAVFIDPGFLQTLPDRQLRSGFAEIIKHSLIADEKEWERLVAIENLRTLDWLPILIPSLQIKQRIVEEDPFEKNIRKALNFGHTIGHALESYALESTDPLLHGEAIAIGMYCEAWLSTQITGLSMKSLQSIQEIILKHYGKYSFPESSFPELLNLMRQDKKNEQQQINFTMLKKVGASLINQHCSEDLILASLNAYRELELKA
ncbi:MAG: 3-dehydroquinate synthase [Bacteroidota bacterium]